MISNISIDSPLPSIWYDICQTSDMTTSRMDAEHDELSLIFYWLRLYYILSTYEISIEYFQVFDAHKHCLDFNDCDKM